MRPLIGVPTCLDARERWKPGRTYQYIDIAYARAVAEAGGVPVYLGLGAEPEALVARLDGLLIPGGDDLLPATPYPEAVTLDPAPAEQIAFDTALLAAAQTREIPILGICYGMQLLALGRGGRLHYDIGTDVPEAGEHQRGEAERHRIEISAGSRLAGIFEASVIDVNSRHHQAVADPGDGLRISAEADDGIAEALEGDAAAFCVGVQWHPESLEPLHRTALFGAFVAACAEHSSPPDR
ncbi:MAG: gamma-glutamyl-gamma-aminobutyrate hydrolase family protein [Deltaproteobacteria bacterium]|nr:gamma-glutamyl-gamma-aminobutyrate hydrolase family protein [Deltaproteobacteria bacterium]MBW2360066.1 gamma-glutamyl-gamma-aminobutyrate hydrolase family protein [Deltaproteobacteria bacterium]